MGWRSERILQRTKIFVEEGGRRTVQKRRIGRGTLRERKKKRSAQRNREGCVHCPLRIRLIFSVAVPPWIPLRDMHL